MRYQKQNTSNDSNPMSVRAGMKVLASLKRSHEVGLLKEQCSCNHKNLNGSVALIPQKPKSGEKPIMSKFSNNPMCICTSCQKYVDITKIEKEEVAKAIDILDRVCDFAKIKIADSQNISNHDQLHDQITQFQYKLIQMIPDVYKFVDGKGKNKNKKKGKGNGGGNNGGFEIHKPTIR